MRARVGFEVAWPGLSAGSSSRTDVVAVQLGRADGGRPRQLGVELPAPGGEVPGFGTGSEYSSCAIRSISELEALCVELPAHVRRGLARLTSARQLALIHQRR